MQPKRLKSQKFDFLLESEKSKAMVDVCINVLQSANELANADVHYEWSVHTNINTLNCNSGSRLNRTLVLFGDVNNRWQVAPEQRSKLRHQMQQSQRIMLIGGAAFLPRQLDVFKEHMLVVHPNFIAAAIEENFPVENTNAPFSATGRVKSAISGIAALNLFIEVLSEDLGHHTGIMIAEYLGLLRPKKDYLSKNSWKYLKQARGDQLISSSIKVMRENIETPIQVRKIAEKMGISPRQMERRFQKKINETPLTTYRNLRLEYANQLILYTDMPINEVGLASGFPNSATFSRWYKQKYKIRAAEARNCAYEAASQNQAKLESDLSYYNQRLSS